MEPLAEHERPRTAVVAGGTGALGSELVDVLLGRGEQVCVPWVTGAHADRLRERHAESAAEGRLRLSPCDLTDPDACAALFDVLAADWGPVWLACSVAGAWAGGQRVDEADDVTVLDRMLTSNLRTAFVLAREGLRHMGSEGGRVVLVGSATVDRPAAGQAAYTAAKAGVHALVGTLAAELEGSGRTANAVVPRIIDTPANRAAMPDANHDRWASARDIAKVIAWLGSTESRTVNGALVPVPA